MALENRDMTKSPIQSPQDNTPPQEEEASCDEVSIEKARKHLSNASAQNRLSWAYEQFGESFATTTSFGIQSAVLLHMLHCLNNGSKINVIWIDTGYLPSETYSYADQLSNQLNLKLHVEKK